MTLRSDTALRQACTDNRRLKIDDDVARYSLTDASPAASFTAGQDPILRFSYRAKDSTTDADTSTFMVGFREGGNTVWTNAALLTVTRDDSAAPAGGGTVGTVISVADVITGSDRVFHCALQITDVEAETWATGVEISVDLNGGGAVELFDFRWDLLG